MINGTNFSNLDSLYDIGSFANTYSSNYFWGLIIIAIFIVLIVRLMHEGSERAIAVSSFVCLVLSLPLFYLGWLNYLFPIIFGFLLAGILAYIRWSEY